jgi:predicted small lipoprotein YifL
MQHPRTIRPIALALRVAVALAVVALAACGGRKFPKVYPVKGKILVNGQPAKECQISFHRTSGGDPAVKVTPNGLTDQNGEFQLTSYYANDGAPEGEYVVTIEWRERSGLTKSDFDGPDQLGGAYANAEKNKGLKGFVAQVGRHPLELPPFELTQSAEAKRKLEEAKKRRPSFGGPLGSDR